ncbi:Las1-like-domain-containing protein [Mycena belliarum]|uniref:Las1-like-domain-containing protein n=1 Tax=Mycena belliarum TaxID=1033014 RepID=A0AAD6UG28_9AGAR|nr:Las1-like-domain-containing protein [Mycena belliae]
MRLPRRVPWSSIAELDQLCSWIYRDESDLESKTNAINRLAAWRAITPLPHALESTLALLSAITQDAALSQSSLHHSLRHSYAAAIIRLVNGLVDPLQLGAYARSIASIANQLGLPPWLVELRHAATHEDLPSLELLRQAARESMTWLLHNYFLPTLNPSTVPPPQAAPLRPLAPALKQYKALRKIVTRDASLRSQYQPQIKSVLKDVERWIAEATVAANVAGGELGWDPAQRGDQNAKERWALERICDALMEKGALVPLSKKKRAFATGSFTPPSSSVELWKPLLAELQALHPDFLAVLSRRIVAHLLASAPQLDIVPIAVDTTYDTCLARWALWTIDSWDGDNSESDLDLKKDVIVALITGLGPSTNSSRDTTAATSLLQALCVGDPDMDEAVSILLRPQTGLLGREWSPTDISVMSERLSTLLADPITAETAPCDPSAAGHPELEDSMSAVGWRLLGASWRPCPIGVYVVR